MKAAHRKELHTNALADRMGRLVESVKAGPTPTSIIVWIFVAVAVGTFAVWRYYSNTAPVTDSARWVELRQATHDPGGMPADLESISKHDKGTMQARIARFQLARLFVREGQENLGSDTPLAKEEIAALKQSFGDALTYDTLRTRRDQAVEMLRGARKIYEQMIREAKSFPILYQEALMGAAKTEEALAGVNDEAGNPQGNLDQALGHYRTLVLFNLKQLGTSAVPDQAVTTLQGLVYDQLKKLGQECEPDTALQTYQRLAQIYPDKFKGDAGTWRDLSSPGRAAAARAKELQQPEKVQKFYARLNELATPQKTELPKRVDDFKLPVEPKPAEEPKKADDAKKAEPPPKPADVKKDEPKTDAPKGPEVKKGSDAKGK
jgi:hypothetical protein